MGRVCKSSVISMNESTNLKAVSDIFVVVPKQTFGRCANRSLTHHAVQETPVCSFLKYSKMRPTRFQYMTTNLHFRFILQGFNLCSRPF
jgi:hypothetical protein